MPRKRHTAEQVIGLLRQAEGWHPKPRRCPGGWRMRDARTAGPWRAVRVMLTGETLAHIRSSSEAGHADEPLSRSGRASTHLSQTRRPTTAR